MARRFKLYLTGFLLGTILVIFLYSDKTEIIFGWMPEKRVLKRLRLTEKQISDSMQCLLNCNGFSETEWKLLYSDGKVGFSEARKKPYPVYTVKLPETKQQFHLRFLAKDSISELIGFDCRDVRHCNCH